MVRKGPYFHCFPDCPPSIMARFSRWPSRENSRKQSFRRRVTLAHSSLSDDQCDKAPSSTTTNLEASKGVHSRHEIRPPIYRVVGGESHQSAMGEPSGVSELLRGVEHDGIIVRTIIEPFAFDERCPSRGVSEKRAPRVRGIILGRWKGPALIFAVHRHRSGRRMLSHRPEVVGSWFQLEKGDETGSLADERFSALLVPLYAELSHDATR